MGWLYLGQDRGMGIRAGCIWVRIGVCGYGPAVSRLEYVCEDMGWLYLGQDIGVFIWAGCISVSIGVCEYGLSVSRSG
jgi:hypothetical protein